MFRQQSAQPPERRILTVSGLNREVRFHLESGFSSVWVEGEISNLYRARSGHSYFVLKDDAAQVKCALFRQRNPYGAVKLAEGQQILARGRISLYEPRGDCQLIVDHVEDAGEGRLRREFERLKQQLAAEGLFASENKRPLPRFPSTLAVLTSPDGAAIRDVISVIGRRFPAVRLVVVPSRVQGAEAEAELRAGLERAIALAPDAILITRGGGSLEDLWAFNDEGLARAIAACPIPTICAVGHETDVSIAEFAADVRAATPSAAAELLVPDGAELRARIERATRALERRDPRLETERQGQRIDELGRRMVRVVERTMERGRDRSGAAAARLRAQHPAQRITAAVDRCIALQSALRRRIAERVSAGERSATVARHALLQAGPDRQSIRGEVEGLARLTERLARAGSVRIERAALAAAGASRRLETLNPQAVLDRGYSVTRRAATGEVVRDPDQLAEGDELVTRVASGEFRSRVASDDPEL